MKRYRPTLAKVLVDGVQYRLIGIAVLHFVLILAVVASALLVPLVVRLGAEGEYNADVVTAARQFMDLHRHVWPPLLFTLALLILHHIIVSHRIAGPLHRIRRELLAIGAGDLSRCIKVRRRDYLTKEAEALNGMILALKDRVDRIDGSQEAAAAALARLEAAAQDNSIDRFNAALADLRANLYAAHEAAHEFETGRERQPRQEADVLEPVA